MMIKIDGKRMKEAGDELGLKVRVIVEEMRNIHYYKPILMIEDKYLHVMASNPYLDLQVTFAVSRLANIYDCRYTTHGHFSCLGPSSEQLMAALDEGDYQSFLVQIMASSRIRTKSNE